MKVKREVSAGGIVYKKEGGKTKWLIAQHSYHKGWIFPKGLVGDKAKEEQKEEAALREVEEEGGIKAKIVHREPVIINYAYRWQDNLVKKTVYYFLMEYLSGDPKNHDWEVLEAKFINDEEIKKTLTYKSDKEAFEKALNVFLSLSSSKEDK